MIWWSDQIVIRKKKILLGHLIAYSYLLLFLLVEKSSTGS